MLFQANFRFPVVGDGYEGLSHSMFSEALISLGDWKYRHVWPFLSLGLGIAPGHLLSGTGSHCPGSP